MVGLFLHVVAAVWIVALQWQVNLLKNEVNISTNDILDDIKDDMLERVHEEFRVARRKKAK